MAVGRVPHGPRAVRDALPPELPLPPNYRSSLVVRPRQWSTSAIQSLAHSSSVDRCNALASSAEMQKVAASEGDRTSASMLSKELIHLAMMY